MTDQKTYPPIRDYALIGDCRTAALISKSGSVEWLCLPDFDSPSLFCSMLDREKGGYLRVAPRQPLSTLRHYIEGTNVLETIHRTETGTLKVTDFLPVVNGESFRLEPERELLRVIEAVEGTPEVEVEFVPRPGYGRAPARLEKRGKLGWTVTEPAAPYLLRSDIELASEDGATATGRERIAQGERRYVSLSYTGRDAAVIPCIGKESDEKFDYSIQWWRAWSSQCNYEGPFKTAVLRSALALKALQFALSGAVVAAATTSLPEAIGAERNWDYRYCWLRDASFTLLAFTDTGFFSEGAAFFNWLMHITRMTHPTLQPLYSIYGLTRLKEAELEHLDGYRGSRPVRIGNGAFDQLQLDTYGSLIAAAADFVERGNGLSPDEGALLAKLGETVIRLWRQPDNGIWEFRKGRMHNTWSKVMCWSSLDNLLRLHDGGALRLDRPRFEREREALFRTINEQHFDKEMNSFVGAAGEKFLDATLLLLPRYGFIDANDPRMLGTWRQIEKRLQHEGLIRRYDEGTDSMSGSEGAFVICSFWAVTYLAQAGRVSEAKERMQSLLSRANDVGLFSEEIDAHSGAFLGNFPQAFSHSGVINAALAIAVAEEREKR